MVAKANEILEEYATQGFTLTTRQLYYQFVARDLLANTKRTYLDLAAVVASAREGGLIDWDHIEDRTRSLDRMATWESPSGILQAAARQYRRDKWAEQPQRVECWVEKDALLGVVERACGDLEVPFLSCRGYPSVSVLYEAACRLASGDVVLHLGDHDPTGIDVTRSIQEKLDLYGSGAEVHRIALTWEQVQEYDPPPNPAKEEDARYAGYVEQYGTESWELDALEPQVIVDLISDEVEALMDEEAWAEGLRVEDIERQAILKAASGLDG